MMRGALSVAAAWLAFLGVGWTQWNPLSRSARPRVPSVAAWVVDWSDAVMRDSMRSLEAADGALGEIDLFRLRLSPSGDLVDAGAHNTLHKRMLEVAASAGAERLVTLVNDVVGADGKTVELKSPSVPHAVFADPAQSIALVEQIVERVEHHGYDGLDLDFEELYAADRAELSRFARHCSRRLHDRGKRFVVTVQAQTKPETRDGPGAQDLAALAAAADEVRLMAYHEHYATTPPGASASLPWTESLLEYALRFVPPEKLVIAIYVGGWRWTGNRGEQLSFAETGKALRTLGVASRRSAEAGVPYAHAETPDGPVEIWYEDACSVKRKADLARQRGIRGVALWRLGQEDLGLYALLRSPDARCAS